ncbi:MAG TPA: DUF2007 domain-containing protein [Atribacter sp.]|jgi:hypothetical protein|uniref:DUF2007 domain-containing protein n=1 Tax=Candidatus Atribacter allofermentans TaxID=1852833 RepID=A0A1V5SJ00_9BACT|nr:DUF2007 domain-containing protein [Atribacter sp.]MDI9594094.1 DUF2007 domain-containing protein [Atribacterota bacterium]OQA54223.1 MAG: hypothetical protein BWY41_02195 [Candidatus Atribacteria bacterium ADurb.Bin276]HHT09304.1 DUF2007 domain-containing protein [Candidatus Atribacteria bacterium]HQK83639.1 DUF2007 domain-containing protein [Atribacter sp.]
MNYRTVKLAQNNIEAELIKGFLEAEGIKVILKPSTQPYGGIAYFGDTGPIEVQVKENQMLQAKSIIHDMEIKPVE